MLKHDSAGAWTIKEQIVEDELSGLTLQFEVLPDGRCVCRVFGNLPFGNREFRFDEAGEEIGAGTSFVPIKPTWYCKT